MKWCASEIVHKKSTNESFKHVIPFAFRSETSEAIITSFLPEAKKSAVLSSKTLAHHKESPINKTAVVLNITPNQENFKILHLSMYRFRVSTIFPALVCALSFLSGVVTIFHAICRKIKEIFCAVKFSKNYIRETN